MFSKLIIIRILYLYKKKKGKTQLTNHNPHVDSTNNRKKAYFMEIVLVELPNETRKVGVFEHAWKDGLCEFIHVLCKGGMIRLRWQRRVTGYGHTLTTKASPAWFHETTCEKLLSSSILL